MRRTWILILVTSLAGCYGAPPSEPSRPVEVKPEPPPPPPPTGIETISADDLKRHVYALASDEYLGRETVQEGARLAAKYLADRFAEYGLEPLPGHKDFLVGYQLQEFGFDPAATSMSVASGDALADLQPGTDFAPFSFSDDGSVDADVVFAGYGISAPDLKHDDYKGFKNKDLKGKLVFVLRHAPDWKNEKSPFRSTQHSYFRTKALEAYKRGAAGLILVTDPLSGEGGDDLRLGGRLRLPPKAKAPTKPDAKAPAKPDAKAPAKPDAKAPAKPVRGGDFRRGKAAVKKRQFLAIHISQSAAEKLIAGLGMNLTELQKSVDAGTPVSKLSIGKVRSKISVTKRDKPRPVTAHNVIGFLEGSDPVLKNEWIVIGAHYDHLGAFEGTGDTVYNGADDNASGTAGMLELAQAFTSLEQRPKRSIVFTGFSGEEKGLLGSRALLEQELLPVDKIAFMLNLDMIGRNPDKPIEVAGDGYGTGLTQAVTAANTRVKANIKLGGTDYAANSDHHPFFMRDIPVLFFFSGLHDDYHQLSDHADKLAYAHANNIVKLCYGVIEKLASAAEMPRFVHHVTWLGIAIQVVDNNGAKHAVITAVEKNSRATKVGIVVGDEIKILGTEALSDPTKVGEKFRSLKPGTKTLLTIARAGVSHTMTIERARTGYLGVMLAPIEDDERKKLGLGDDEGIKITGLSGDGPAGKAGIEKDDILIRIAGHPVGGRTLRRHLSRIGAGEKVSIVVVRAGKRVTLSLVLGKRPERRRP